MKSQRNNFTMQTFLNALNHEWQRVPDWRFTQLISNVFSSSPDHWFYVEDEDFLKHTREYLNKLGVKKNNMYYYDKNDFSIPQGWICPRCGRVNAPFMPWCSCGDVPTTVSSTQTYPQHDMVTPTTTAPDNKNCEDETKIDWKQCMASASDERFKNVITAAHNSPMKDAITLDTSKLSEEDKKNLETFISEWR